MTAPFQGYDGNVLALAPRPQVPVNIVEAQLLGAILDLGVGEAATYFEIAGISDTVLQDRRVANAWLVARYLSDNMRIVNAATVFSAARAASRLTESDEQWLTGLQTGNTLNRDSFAQIAKDLQRTILGRGLAVDLEQMVRDLRTGQFSVSKMAAALEQASESLMRSDIHAETAATDVIELDEKWEERERTGRDPMMLTRIKLLDEATCSPGGGGGFPPKFGVIMGQPGVGKNMFLAGLMRAQLLADPDLKIGLFALEDGSRWLLKRWVALDLGIPLSAVGVKKRTPEQLAKLEELKPWYFKLLERVPCYRFRKIQAQEMLHVSRGWIHQQGVREILFDNLTHLDHRQRQTYAGSQRFQNEKRNEIMAAAVESFAELADRKEVPIVALAHTIRPESEKHDERPPRLSEVADSAGIERVVRFAAGLWRTRSRDLRLTIQKNTEGPGTGVTIELERIIEAATIEPDGGRVVNLEQEAREERKGREKDKLDEKIAQRRLLKARMDVEKAKDDAEAKAKAEAAMPPQLTLLPGGEPEAPKS